VEPPRWHGIEPVCDSDRDIRRLLHLAEVIERPIRRDLVVDKRRADALASADVMARSSWRAWCAALIRQLRNET